MTMQDSDVTTSIERAGLAPAPQMQWGEWWRALRTQMRLACTSGHIPNPPSDGALRWMRRVARALVWVQVGRVEVRGEAHLACGSPMLITPTHGHYVDPFVLALALPGRVRCMAARGLMKIFGGLGGAVFASWGAFCTDLDPGKGGPALKAAARILASGQSVVMFPEGWAYMDGVVGDFKKGAVAVARMAESSLGSPVSIVPVHMRYGAYPRSWIRRLPPTLQYLVVLAGIPLFRRGVCVVFGPPLRSADLPSEASRAAEALRRAVLALDPST